MRPANQQRKRYFPITAHDREVMKQKVEALRDKLNPQPQLKLK